MAETYCGQISGFKFSNGSSSTTITNNGTYTIGDLPNNFFVDVKVSGYSQSAKIRVKNLNTGQYITIQENYLPYTFPGGNGAWSYGPGTYEIKAKLYKYNYCNSYSCDTETIRFTLTNTPPCGQIDGLAFSNGTNSVNITNGGTYDIASLPYNFYVDVLVSGVSESAYNRITNLDTGAVYSNTENVLPYTYPAGNSAWTLGTGTFQFYSSVYKYNNLCGTKCDAVCITFTIYEDNCGDITEFQFTNGTDQATTIVDGGLYTVNDLPAGFYIDGIVNGDSDSLRFEVTNVNTGQVYNIIENYLPYTFPAGNGAWFLGTGTFQVKGSLFTGNYCNGTLCDEDTVTFTITDGPDEVCDAEAGSTNTDGSIYLVLPGFQKRVQVTPGPNAVLPEGYNYCTLISSKADGSDDDDDDDDDNGSIRTIKSFEVGLSAAINQAGLFRVHLLVYNPETLDLNSIVPGTTTPTDVLNTLANNNICASLDDAGKSIVVITAGPDERAANTDEPKVEPIKGEDLQTVETTKNTLVSKPEEVVETASVDIKLYPNPVVDNLNVELLLLDAEVMNYQVFDLNGKQVIKGAFDNSTFGKTQVNTSALSTGLYVVKFQSNFRSFSKKIQVSK
ncbi:T9SS type A sorting domain-containing protein [Lacinutrix sp. MedPE-SW]|uniref:T9SS type A sorting domain-containing protein n=1 Tax=Lacinutrix sp. MedPE-SW TaxID=1860087 RepID=UPI000AF48011|nr:T9SS type A sorting domain-containing protein [Lacinutrix sp. MedPE-SW]